jgi:uncharacterized delta-60 repeat protein
VVAARRLSAIVAVALSVLGAAAAPVAAAPADLDRSFGGDGTAQVEAPSGPVFPEEATARLAIGPRDEALVLYSSYAPCPQVFECVIDLAIARYDAAGNRDASFGVGPGSRLQVRQSLERGAFALAVGPDGKAVVAASDGARGAVTVARFNRGGRLDATFGAGGQARVPAPIRTDTRIAVAVQPDGKVVVAGAGEEVEEGEQLVLARYLPNGELDPGFGSGGVAATLLSTQARPAALLLDRAGRLTVPAPLCCVGGRALFGGGFSLLRTLGEGRPDPAFGGTGLLFLPTPGAEGAVEAAALGPDGDVFLSFEESTEALMRVGNVIKLTAGGGIDGGFGREGRLRLFQRVGAIDATALVVDSEDRLTGVGWGEDGVSAYRLRADGSADRTFNGGRQLTASRARRGLGVALQSSGRIVVLAGTGLCCGPRLFELIALRGGTDRTRCLGRRATVVGTRKADELTGTPRRDVIAALGGNDEVRGLGGSDLICGGRGRDRLLGGPGRDLMRENPIRARPVR